jgi:hypothetical protein
MIMNTFVCCLGSVVIYAAVVYALLFLIILICGVGCKLKRKLAPMVVTLVQCICAYSHH